MDEKLRNDIIALIKREVVPATGCTEPVAAALAVAYASSLIPEAHGSKPELIELHLSANMLKNAMGVGIPGTGMIGLPIATALGYVVADPSKGLTVLDGFSPEQLDRAKAIVDDAGIIQIKLKENVDKLYIEVNITAAGHTSTAIIEKVHTRLISLKRDEEEQILTNSSSEETAQDTFSESGQEEPTLTFDMVYDFAMNTPLEQISFIEESARLNKIASDLSLKGNYGHAVGKMIQGPLGKKYLGENTHTRMLTYTSAACDARMDGAPIAVMSNSGSGNQGITATIPVLTFAEDEKIDYERTIRALTLSNLIVIYIKQRLGRLSALCGCVVAATGSSCGLTYLMGGDRGQVGYAVKNMVGNITGMLCDGAKPSCAMKVSSGVSSAMLSALLAIEHKYVTSNEGIVDDDIDRTVDNLTSIGREAMQETDRRVLKIMTTKGED